MEVLFVKKKKRKKGTKNNKGGGKKRLLLAHVGINARLINLGHQGPGHINI